MYFFMLEVLLKYVVTICSYSKLFDGIFMPAYCILHTAYLVPFNFEHQINVFGVLEQNTYV